MDDTALYDADQSHPCGPSQYRQGAGNRRVWQLSVQLEFPGRGVGSSERKHCYATCNLGHVLQRDGRAT